MSVLVVCYSFTGTCRRVAQDLCAQMSWPVGEIIETVPGRGTLRCVLDSVLRRRPAIAYRGPAPHGFDTVVLVSPVWLYRLAGPMRSFVKANTAGLRQTAVVSVMGQRGGLNAAAEIGASLPRAPVFSTTVMAREVEDGSHASRLRAFAKAVAAASDDVPPLRPSELSPAIA
jgi:hypothetical protein